MINIKNTLSAVALIGQLSAQQTNAQEINPENKSLSRIEHGIVCDKPEEVARVFFGLADKVPISDILKEINDGVIRCGEVKDIPVLRAKKYAKVETDKKEGLIIEVDLPIENTTVTQYTWIARNKENTREKTREH